MQNPRLASRYAKSLLDLAVGNNTLDITLSDMQYLAAVCRQSHDFINMLRSPIIHADKKHHIMAAIFDERLHKTTSAFVSLLINKGRESNLPEIAESFIAQYNIMKQIRTVTLTTAVAVDDTVKNKILGKIKTSLPEQTVALETAIDSDLIGGFILETEDKLFDASVRKHLNDFKTAVQDNSYVMQLR
jgi:F-type H+-transporting ATPase subunit delta